MPKGAPPIAAMLHLQRAAGNGAVTAMVQRHASWEHKMLGDVEPATLEVIASGRDAAASGDKTIEAGDRTISVDNVVHALDQEIRRVQYFRDHAPTTAGAKGVKGLVKLDKADRDEEAVDTEWDVRLVEVGLEDGSKAVLTYGEMNTMADIYGNPEEMRQTPAANFRKILAGIREESVRKLMRLRNEIGGVKKYDRKSDQYAFEGSIGNVGKGDKTGELALMGKFGAEGKATVPGSPETSYSAGLARNACHFAPQSWHAWGQYHEEAIALAKEAQGAEKKTREKKANEALIRNGFGDHFLQDSFAAGHLINKTLIMQWFVKWLDQHRFKSKQTLDTNWRKAQHMAYAQPGLAGRSLYTDNVGSRHASDPQSAENVAGDMEARFDAAGLELPWWMDDHDSDEFKVFVWWQGVGALNPGNVTFTIEDVNRLGPVQGAKRLETVLANLHDATVIHYANYSVTDLAKGVGKIGTKGRLGHKKFVLRAEFVPKHRLQFNRARKAAERGDMAAYQKMAKVTAKSDYSNFLNNAYLQIATNVLHDDFCKNGLVVRPEAGPESFKVYGDNAMLQSESAKGVVWSAKTARASRDSIYETINNGEPGAGHSTADIAARLPTKVTPAKGGDELSLEEWHGEGGALWRYCDTQSFPAAAALFAKGTVAGLLDLAPSLSKDDAHAAKEGF